MCLKEELCVMTYSGLHLERCAPQKGWWSVETLQLERPTAGALRLLSACRGDDLPSPKYADTKHQLVLLLLAGSSASFRVSSSTELFYFGVLFTWVCYMALVMAGLTWKLFFEMMSGLSSFTHSETQLQPQSSVILPSKDTYFPVFFQWLT